MRSNIFFVVSCPVSILDTFAASISYLQLILASVASWLMSSTPDRAVRVRTLARDIVLCSWLSSHSASLHPGV